MSFFYGAAAASTYLFKDSKIWSIFYSITFLALESLFNYWPFGGFNWGSYGFITVDNPFSNALAVVGVFGFSVLIMTFTILIIEFFRLYRLKAYGPIIVSMMLWIGFVGFLDLIDSKFNQIIDSGELSIAAIQGNVPRLGLEFNAQRKAVYQNHLTETQKLLKGNPELDLIIWPENAPDVDPFANSEVINELNLLAKIADTPILIGSRMQTSDGSVNASILIEGDTKLDNSFIYAKQKLVPFGERVPFESYLGPIASNFGPITQSLNAGERTGILEITDNKLGLLICFEVAWGQLALSAIDSGAEVLIVQTNNATYGLTSQLIQQFNIAKIRAIESQRQVLTVATSGISGLVDQDGSVIWEADEFVPTSAVLNVDLYEGKTLGILLNYYLQIMIMVALTISVFLFIFKDSIIDYVK